MANNLKPNDSDSQAAADLIRDKVLRAYAEEPAANQELLEAESLDHLSRHQQFMLDLNKSGKDQVAIQNDWHQYYLSLSNQAKHQVWQEFYAAQSKLTAPIPNQPQAMARHKQDAVSSRQYSPSSTKSKKLSNLRSSKQVQAAIRAKVSGDGQLKARHHLQSLLFGLGLGLIVVFIFLFSFFNEVIIAPLIQPSRAAAATPIIVSSGSIAPTTTPEVIIPKINVEIPVNYSETSTNEADIENDLQDGVVHYPTTSLPGQDGNTAFFGHSSNNILNPGKYKFAFVLLHTLVTGDTFYLTYNDKVYVYQVISRSIVDPNDVGVLGAVAGQTATATLITCDPPGTSLHRLIVVGKQVSPDPSTNTQAPVITASAPTSLPNDGPTLWSRFITTGLGKAVVVVVIVGTLIIVIRWINQPKGY